MTDLAKTTVLLIRHAMTDSVGHRLSGRMPGVRLNAAGEAEPHALSQSLRLRRIDAIYTSPLDRAVQTAEAIARFHPLPSTHHRLTAASPPPAEAGRPERR